MSVQDKIPFSAVIDALLDERRPFPASYLRRFSDIPSLDLKALTQVWSQVPVNRRRTLLEDLEDVVEADTTVSFHDFGRYALDDPDSQVRLFAIRLLWEEDDDKFIPTFIRMMETDTDPLVRAAAASALGLFVYNGELEELPEETLHEVEDHLLEVTRSQDLAEVRRRALESLGYSSRPEVPDLLENAYKKGSLEWVASSLFAMGRSADQRWKQYIEDLLDHPSAPVRLEAMRAAGELDLKSSLQPLLTAAYKDEDIDVRHAAIWSLSQLGGDPAQRLLEKMLEKEDDDEEIEILEDALENLSFTNDMEQFNFLEVDDESLDDQETSLDDYEEE